MSNHILYVIDSLGSGGAQRQLTYLAAESKRRGWDVTVLVYHDEPFYEHILIDNDIRIVKVLTHSYLARTLRMRSFIRGGRFDVVISFLEAANFICELSALPYRNWRLIVGERNANPNIVKRPKLRMYRWFHLLADVIVSNSKANLELVVEACFLLKTKPMVFLPNAYDVSYWGASYERTTVVPLRMAIIAGYENHKNPESVIHALALYYASESHIPLRVDWFGKDRGDGSYQRAVKLIEHYGLSDFVYLNGEHTDVREVYRQSDFVGLFSRYEGLPNVLCESMLVGIPFVASRISDIPSLCLDDRCLCDPSSIQSIADSIRYMTSLPDSERKSLGTRYQTRAIDSYSPERVFKTLEEAIHV